MSGCVQCAGLVAACVTSTPWAHARLRTNLADLVDDMRGGVAAHVHERHVEEPKHLVPVPEVPPGQVRLLANDSVSAARRVHRLAIREHERFAGSEGGVVLEDWEGGGARPLAGVRERAWVDAGASAPTQQQTIVHGVDG